MRLSGWEYLDHMVDFYLPAIGSRMLASMLSENRIDRTQKVLRYSGNPINV